MAAVQIDVRVSGTAAQTWTATKAAGVALPAGTICRITYEDSAKGVAPSARRNTAELIAAIQIARERIQQLEGR